MRHVLTLPLVVTLLALGACESSSNSQRNNKKTTNNTSLNHRVVNFRAVMRQANSDATFILVNDEHALRKTRDGRKQLALNSSQQAYKALTAKNIDGLLTMFNEANASFVKEPWVNGDEKLISQPITAQSSVRGVIMMEHNGQRYKLIGRRPKGPEDVIGREKYMTFSKLKRIFFYWDNATSRAERADTALIGGSSNGIETFDLKRKRN